MVNENYIAKRLRELRKSANLDVDTVGDGVGRSGKTISAWENGRNVPSADMLITICKFFDVDIDYFYPPEVTKGGDADMTLSADEVRLVGIYRSMSAEGRARLLEQADFLASRHPLNQAVQYSA